MTDVFLDSFSSRLHELTLQLYAIRKIVRPDLGTKRQLLLSPHLA